MSNNHRSLAIIGGGPSALFVYKNLLDSGQTNLSVTIFESNNELGKGMPYSNAGANIEHVTNVSGNEIPELKKPVIDWIRTLPDEVFIKYQLQRDHLHEYMVLPRLLFGDYLKNQFDILLLQGESKGLATEVFLSCTVTDIKDDPAGNRVKVDTMSNKSYLFDHVVICSGHLWPVIREGKVPGYFDSPYPPSKLNGSMNHSVAIRGSSLTAIDAIRTIARKHGSFQVTDDKLTYTVNEETLDFKIILHSRQGLLPAIRFHLDDPKLGKNSLLSKEEILNHIVENGGFLSLDFIFERNFKDALKDKDPAFYQLIKNMGLEEFVDAMMNRREKISPFQLFREEYREAAKSIRKRESVYWKEMLAVLSFAMNYPAKHLPAEDMLRLQKVLMPLISIVIAFVPQNSSEEMLALHEAGRLELIAVGDDSVVEPQPGGGIMYFYRDEKGDPQQNYYSTFIDCAGQGHLSLNEFPFQSLVRDGSVSAARLKFQSPGNAVSVMDKHKAIEEGENSSFFLKVPGIAITDNFRVIDQQNIINPRIYVMAVSCIGGYNPDYSGLDFCEEAAKIIVKDLFSVEC